MKRFYILSLMILGLASCGTQSRIVSITNSSSIDRVDEVVEIEIANPDLYTIFTADGVQVQCQTTADGNLLFAANVEANSTVKYELREGNRLALDTLATGGVYPQWFNDFAWENDKIGFRIYSEMMVKRGERLFGYDIFTKRAKIPVLDILYGVQFDEVYQSNLKRLRAEKSSSAQSLSDAITYHVDHGIGMDYYAVGPTLGSGASALMSEGEIIYPGYYTKSEILEKGGLRLKFRLTFPPVDINGDMVTEVRTITLDAGTHFNYIEVEYQGLTKQSAAAIGIVIHDDGSVSQITDSYMAYAEPVHQYGWQTYNAVIFPENMKASLVLFDEAKGAAQGHLLATGDYAPATKLSYYMGAGWNRWGFANADEWFAYVKKQQEALSTPLTYQIK